MIHSTVKPIPVGMHTVTPHLICGGATDAIEFYKSAFGAIETSRQLWPDGKLLHGAVSINGSTIMLAEEMPQWGSFGPKERKGTSVYIHLYVEDVDAVVAQAVVAGATIVMPVSDMFWGDRYGQIEDPFGHRWSVATHIRDATPEEMHQAVMKMSAR